MNSLETIWKNHNKSFNEINSDKNSNELNELIEKKSWLKHKPPLSDLQSLKNIDQILIHLGFNFASTKPAVMSENDAINFYLEVLNQFKWDELSSNSELSFVLEFKEELIKFQKGLVKAKQAFEIINKYKKVKEIIIQSLIQNSNGTVINLLASLSNQEEFHEIIKKNFIAIYQSFSDEILNKEFTPDEITKRKNEVVKKLIEDILKESETFILQHSITATVTCEVAKELYKGEIQNYISTNINLLLAEVGEKSRLNAAKEVQQLFLDGPGWFPLNGENEDVLLWIDLNQGMAVVNAGNFALQHHYHAKITDIDPLTNSSREQIKHQLYLKTASVDKSRLQHLDFFQAIVNFNILGCTDLSIYDGLFTYLKAKPELPVSDQSLFKKITITQSNPLKTLSTALFYSLSHSIDDKSKKVKESQNCHKKLKFYIELNAFLGYCKKHLANLTQEQIKFIKEIKDNIAREAEKLYVKKILTDNDLESLHATCEDINQKLMAAIPPAQKLLDHDLAMRNHVKTELPDTYLSFDALLYESLFTRETKGKEATSLASIKKIFYEIMQQELSSNIEEKVKKFETGISFLVEELERFKGANRFEKFPHLYLNSLELIRDFICGLPIPKNEDTIDIWSQIPENQVVSCMKSLNNILSVLFLLNSNYQKEANINGHNPEITIMAYSIYAIVDKLARKTNVGTKFLKNKPSFYFHLELEIKTSKFVVDHCGLQKHLTNVLHYFNPNHSIEDYRTKETEEYIDQKNEGLFSIMAKQQFSSLYDFYMVNFFNKTLFGEKLTSTGLLFKEILKSKNVIFHDKKDEKRKIASLIASIGKSASKVPEVIDLLAQVSFKCQKGISNLELRAYDVSSHVYVGGYDFQVALPIKNYDQFSYLIKPNLSESAYLLSRTIATQRSQNQIVKPENEETIEQIKAKHNSTYANKLEFTQSNFKLNELDEEVVKILKMNGVDPYDEANRVIDAVATNRSLLRYNEIRYFLKVHLFRPERLFAQLKDNPEFVKVLSKFFDEVYKYYEDNSEILAFLSELNFKIERFIKESDFDLKGYTSIRSKLLSRLSEFTNEQKLQICEGFIKSYHNISHSQFMEEPELLNQMSHDFHLYHMLANMTNVEKPNLDVNLSVSLLRIETIAIDYIKSKNIKGINQNLSSLAKILYGLDLPSNQWIFNDNVFFNGECSIDLFNSKMAINNKQKVSVPKEFTTDRLFLKIISGKIENCSQLLNQKNTYIVNEGMKNETIVTIVKDKFVNLQYFRKIDGEMFRYSQTPYKLRDTIPTLFAHPEKEIFCWKHISLPYICVEDINQNEKYRIELTESYKDILFKTDSIRDVHNKNKFYIPFDKNNSLCQFILKFEETTEAIECWGAESDKIDEINLPLLGLSFQVEDRTKTGVRKIYSKEYPGYYLVDSKEIGWIVLRNHAGEEKILVPRFKFSDETDSLDKKNSLKDIVQQCHLNNIKSDIPLPTSLFKQEVMKTETIKWLEFNHDFKSNTEGKLYLLYYSLIFPSFYSDEHSLEKLLHEISSMKRFSEEELEIFDWIINRSLKVSECRTLKIILKLLVKIEWNRLKYPSAAKSKYEKDKNSALNHLLEAGKLEALLKLYQSIKLNSPVQSLTDEEELCLINMQYRLITNEYKNLEKKRKKTKEKKPMGYFEYIAKYYLIKIKELIFKETYGSRLGLLSDGKLKLGKENSTYFPKFAENIKLDSYYEEDIVEYDVKEKSQKFSNSSLFNLFRNEEELTYNFLFYYSIAQSGSKQDKEKLVRALTLACEYHHPYRDVLLSVSKHPYIYPKIDLEKISSLIKKRDKVAERDKNGDTYILDKKIRNNFKKMNKAIQSRYNTINTICLIAKICFIVLREIAKKIYRKLSKAVKILSKAIHKSPIIFSNEAIQNLDNIDEEFRKWFRLKTDQYFTKKSEPIVIEDLQLDTQHEDPNAKRKLEKANEELSNYRKSLKANDTYTLKENIKITSLKNEIDLQVKILSDELEIQKSVLLKKVNEISEQTGKNRKHIQKIGQRKYVSWNELKLLCLYADYESFRKNTYLDEKNAQLVCEAMLNFLVKATWCNQLKLIQKSLVDFSIALEKQKKEGVANSDQNKIFIDNIAYLMTLDRMYKPKPENRHLLSFEYANKFFIRENQLQKYWEIIKKWEKSPQLFAEMPAGFGKTKVLVALWNEYFARQGKHTTSVVPHSIEFRNAIDLDTIGGESFEQYVDRIFFNRSSKFSTESLQYLLSLLEKGKNERRPLVLSPSSVRSLLLHLILKLLERSEIGPKPRLDKKITLLIKILRFNFKSKAIIDEGDLSIDPRDKLLYTLNHAFLKSKLLKPTKVPLSHKKFTEKLFRFLESDFKDDLNFAQNKHPLVFNKPGKFEEIKQRIIEKFEKEWNIPSEHKNSFRDYVQGKNSGKIPEWIDKHPNCEEIDLLRGQIIILLKSSLKGYVGKDFGLSKLHINKKQFAIRYTNSNEPKENENSPSQFKNVHEILNKTYITYLKDGLNLSQGIILLNMLIEKAEKEIQNQINPSETEAQKFFSELVPPETLKKVLGKQLLIHKLSSDDVKKLAKLILQDREAIYYYVMHKIDIEVYPNLLVNTVQNFRSQYGEALFLSATPPDMNTAGPNITLVPMENVQGQMTHILLLKGKDPKSLQVLKNINTEKIIAEAQTSKDPQVQATLDPAGLFCGIPNETTARIILKQLGKQVRGMLFFDEKKNDWQAINAETGKIVSPDDITLDIEQGEQHIFYDQARCTGSDKENALRAKANITLSEDMTFRDYAQGAYRMRGITKNQELDNKMLESFAKWIFGENYASDEKLKEKGAYIKKIVGYFYSKQAEEEAQKNYEGQILQMDNEIHSSLIFKILGFNVNPTINDAVNEEPKIEEIIRNFNKWKNELVSIDTFDPRILYGSIVPDQDTVPFLKSYQQMCVKRVEKLKGLSAQEKQLILDRLDQYLKKYINIEKNKDDPKNMALPHKVTVSHADVECNVEVLQEIETEVNLELQVQHDPNVKSRVEWSWPENLDLFSEGWEKPKTHHMIFRRLAIAIRKNGAILINRIRESKMAKFAERSVKYLKNVITFSFVIVPLLLPSPFSYILMAAAVAYIVLKIFNFIAKSFGWYKKFNKKFESSCPIFKVSNVLQAHLPSKLIHCSQFFSPNFLVSNNFYTQVPKSIQEPIQVPFSEEQKPLFEIVVIQDEDKIQIMAIDQNDSVYFRKKLKEDNETQIDASQRKRKIAIYDLHNGIVAQGKNGFAAGELENNSQFQNLLVEAKILNGDIKLTPQEKQIAREKASNLGKELMMKTMPKKDWSDALANKLGNELMGKLFKDNILSHHALSQRINEKAPLFAISV